MSYPPSGSWDWSSSPGAASRPPKLPRRLDIRSQHQRLLNRLLEMLREEGVLQPVAEGWEVISVPEVHDPQPRIAALLAQCPAATAELTLLERCGSRLAQVLQGQCDPLQLLFPEGDFTTAGALYQDSPAARNTNSLLQKAVLETLARLPRNRTLRILEIGAGTGGTTSFILPDLPPGSDRICLYRYLSPVHRSGPGKVRPLFLHPLSTPGHRTTPLGSGFSFRAVRPDPGRQRTPCHQGLEPDPASCPAVVRTRRLAPPAGGHRSRPLRRPDLRLDRRLVEIHRSQPSPFPPLDSCLPLAAFLHDHGFEQPVTLSSSDGILSKQAIVIAQAPETRIEKSPGHWLILADRQGTGTRLASPPASKGESCYSGLPGPGLQRDRPNHEFRIDPDSPADFERLIAAWQTSSSTASSIYGASMRLTLRP